MNEHKRTRTQTNIHCSFVFVCVRLSSFTITNEHKRTPSSGNVREHIMFVCVRLLAFVFVCVRLFILPGSRACSRTHPVRLCSFVFVCWRVGCIGRVCKHTLFANMFANRVCWQTFANIKHWNPQKSQNPPPRNV